MVKIESVTAEIFLIWTKLKLTNVAGTNFDMTVKIESVTTELLQTLNFCWWVGGEG